jgi:hypothetical protein
MVDGNPDLLAILCSDQEAKEKIARNLSTFPLAPRLPGDIGRLRGYGNALNAVVAREFILAVMEELGIGEVESRGFLL